MKQLKLLDKSNTCSESLDPCAPFASGAFSAGRTSRSIKRQSVSDENTSWTATSPESPEQLQSDTSLLTSSASLSQNIENLPLREHLREIANTMASQKSPVNMDKLCSRALEQLPHPRHLTRSSDGPPTRQKHTSSEVLQHLSQVRRRVKACLEKRSDNFAQARQTFSDGLRQRRLGKENEDMTERAPKPVRESEISVRSSSDMDKNNELQTLDNVERNSTFSSVFEPTENFDNYSLWHNSSSDDGPRWDSRPHNNQRGVPIVAPHTVINIPDVGMQSKPKMGRHSVCRQDTETNLCENITDNNQPSYNRHNSFGPSYADDASSPIFDQVSFWTTPKSANQERYFHERPGRSREYTHHVNACLAENSPVPDDECSFTSANSLRERNDEQYPLYRPQHLLPRPIRCDWEMLDKANVWNPRITDA